MAITAMIRYSVFVLFISLVSGQTCENPVVKSNSYSATDGMVVANVAFIAEFSVSCQNGIKDLTLYADVNGKAVPAMRSLDNSKYQVSWTEESSKMPSGIYPVKIYDDEGFALLRKAQRNGEDTSSIKPLFIVDINHTGTYMGPWVHSEFVAVVTSVLLWYLAYSAKAKLQA